LTIISLLLLMAVVCVTSSPKFCFEMSGGKVYYGVLNIHYSINVSKYLAKFVEDMKS